MTADDAAPGLHGDAIVPCPLACGWSYAALMLGAPGGGIFAVEVARDLRLAAQEAISAHLATAHDNASRG